MTDNELLQHFFQPARDLQLSDVGFTDRVMSRLPRRNALRLSRLWTTSCIVVAVILFFLMRGWEIIGFGLLMTINSIHVLQGQLVIILFCNLLIYSYLCRRYGKIVGIV